MPLEPERATSLGSPPLTTFRLVALPMMRPAFLVAALFVFIHSFEPDPILLDEPLGALDKNLRGRCRWISSASIASSASR